MKKIVKIGLMFSILLNILGNFSAGFVSAQESERDTLYIGATNTISGLNPLNSSDVVAQWVERFMYPSLMDQIAPGEIGRAHV